MDHKQNGRVQVVFGELAGKLLGDAARPLTPESLSHIKQLCDSRGVGNESYARWWLETNGRARMFRNIVMSTKTDSSFLEWVDSQRLMSPVMIKLQLDELQVAVKTSYLPPEKLFSRRVRGVSPLVQYTMARYLGYPNSVEWLQQEASEEASAKPWLAEQLTKFKEPPEQKENADKGRS